VVLKLRLGHADLLVHDIYIDGDLGGAQVAITSLRWLLVAACATVTATNLCLPSEALAWWERRSLWGV
jgi:hypothetical protein